MTTTPPMLSVQEPPTPLHGSRVGLLDPHRVRRSPRFTNSHNNNRTPSPGVASGPSPRSLASTTPRRKQSSPRAQAASPRYSPPSSPISPPRMQRTKARGADSKKLEPPVNPPTYMLPTPVKTPRKKEVKQTVKPAARVLFPHRPDTVEEIMPTPRKRARQGLSLESFTENDGGHGEIQIYTDSKDKVPEVDESADNPFYSKKPSSSRKGKKKGKEGPENNKHVQDVLERDEGMVYVFRGKKIYRKFDEIDEEAPEGGERSMRGMPIEDLESPKPFTRSSVKPRFLFGKTNSAAAEKAGSTSDEEAVTDIEEPIAATAETPSKPRTGAPATPPSTHRAKRVAFHTNSEDSANGAEPEAEDPRFTVKKARKASPFDGWQRTKNGPSITAAKGKKRAAEELDRDEAKRVKSREAV